MAQSYLLNAWHGCSEQYSDLIHGGEPVCVWKSLQSTHTEYRRCCTSGSGCDDTACGSEKPSRATEASCAERVLWALRPPCNMQDCTERHPHTWQKINTDDTWSRMLSASCSISHILAMQLNHGWHFLFRHAARGDNSQSYRVLHLQVPSQISLAWLAQVYSSLFYCLVLISQDSTSAQ